MKRLALGALAAVLVGCMPSIGAADAPLRDQLALFHRRCTYVRQIQAEHRAAEEAPYNQRWADTMKRVTAQCVEKFDALGIDEGLLGRDFFTLYRASLLSRSDRKKEAVKEFAGIVGSSTVVVDPGSSASVSHGPQPVGRRPAMSIVIRKAVRRIIVMHGQAELGEAICSAAPTGRSMKAQGGGRRRVGQSPG